MANKLYSDNYLSWFDRNAVAQPAHLNHGVNTEDISKLLIPLAARNWRMQGNKLIADTDMGKLVQTIPTNYICKGTDEKGLPILEKVG